MSEPTTPRQFHEADGVEDWRVVGEGACTYFRTGSFAAGARLVHAIGELGGLEDHHPDVDLRHGGVTVRLITVTDDYYWGERARRRAGPADLGGGARAGRPRRPVRRADRAIHDRRAAPPQRNRIHVDVWVPHDQAEARVAAAIAAGGHLVTDEHAPSWWVLADAEGNEACVATWTSRD
jgi:4a-hydroxytetrahydrobiopterin dehydratase